MRYVKAFYFAAGLALLGVVVATIDIAETIKLAGDIGVAGFVLILTIYLVAFTIDSFTWQMTVLNVPFTPRWLYRFWKARMVGETFNYIMPAAGIGGEPVKAVLLKDHYGIGYREGTASLILSRTINVFALTAFLAVGFLLMLGSEKISVAYKSIAAVGLAALMLGGTLFFLIQRYRVTSIAGTWLSRWRIGRRIETILHHIHDMEERFIVFYTQHVARLIWAVGLAFVNWVLGIFEIYYAAIFLGHPVSLSDAWIIEAMAQMVRTGTFFIPASIGAQEGIFLLMFTAITGSPVAGGAFAVIRRIREIVWAIWGGVISLFYPSKPRTVPIPGDDSNINEG